MRQPFLLVESFVVRDLAKNRIRTVLTVLGIALGVAVMLAINLANNTAFARFEESIDLVAGRTNLEIEPTSQPDVDQEVLKKIQFLWDENVLFTPVIDQLAVLPGAAPDVVEVLGVDMFADPSFRPFSTTSGSQSLSGTDIFNKDSAYIGERFAQKYHLSKGSTFDLLVNDKQRTLTVADVLAYSGPGKAFGGNVIVMDIGPAQVLFDMPGRISRVDMIAPEGTISGITKKITGVLPPSLSVERPSRRGAQVQKMLSAFQYNLAALSLIALLVGMFLIYNTMSMTVVRKRAEIGVLRTLGASRARIFGLFLLQALILGASGSLLGVLLGIGFAHGAVKAVGSTVQALYIDQPRADVAYSGSLLLVAFLTGIALTVLAAWAPMMEAMSVAPAEAVRRASYELRVSKNTGLLAGIGCVLLIAAALASTAPPINGFPVLGYAAAALIIFGVSLCMPLILRATINGLKRAMTAIFGSEGKLAILSLGGTLGRTSVAVASLMIGISMMVSLAIMIGSFRDTVIVWVNQTLKADLYVSPQSRAASKRTGKLSNDVVSRIEHLPGVEDVDAFVEFPIRYKGNPTNLGAGDTGVLMRHGRLLFVGGQSSQSVLERMLRERGCVVTESFALRNNVRPGDTITLDSPRGPFSVRVEGVYYDYVSNLGYIIIPRSLYAQYWNDTYSTTLGVYVQPGANVDDVRSEMVRALGTNTRLNIRTNRELRREVLRVFDNTFAITYALHAIAILVAILGVMNALFALTFDMRRDFAILTYIGASMAQLRKIILLQAGTLGFLGNAAGVAVGFLLSLLLINVINKQSFGWTVQLAIPVPFLVQSFLLIMAFSLLSGWLPARAATKSISPEAVRIE